MLQHDINILISILAAAVQWIDSSGKMVPKGFQRLRSKRGTGTLVALSGVASCHVPGDISAPCMAAAPVQSQRPSPGLDPSPGWVQGLVEGTFLTPFVCDTLHRQHRQLKRFSVSVKGKWNSYVGGGNTWNCVSAWKHFWVTDLFIESSNTVLCK